MPLSLDAATLPPGPRKRFPGDMLLRVRKGPIPFFLDTARQYGDIAYYTSGGQKLYLLSHPDFVKDVLVTNAHKFVKGRGLEKARRLLGEGLLTSEGEFHNRQRRLVQPAMHRLRIKPYASHITEAADQFTDRWRDGIATDVHEDMTRLSLAIAARMLFDADLESEAGELGPAFTDAIRLFDTVMKPFSEILDWLPLGTIKRFERARARLDATIYRVIHERRQSGIDRGDVLSLLLRAADGAAGGVAMTDQQLRDECMTMLLAGHETVANAITWSWYLLSQHPEVEAKVAEEVARIPGGRAPSADDLPRLGYTEMVLAEAMRLYPPVWMLDRRAIEPHTLAGYTIPVDSIVVICPYVLHHDARFFPDPEKFVVERWTPEARASRSSFCYFPFGAGPRQCIGEALAWMEGVTVIASIIRSWKLTLEPGHKVELLPGVTLRPRYGMRMIPSRRSI